MFGRYSKTNKKMVELSILRKWKKSGILAIPVKEWDDVIGEIKTVFSSLSQEKPVIS